MMRSLWSGVSGLQAHQIAMDVEGNNIANVNTVGYKYETVSFADQMSQTSKTATGPEGTRGGTNATQVGLGTSVQAVTKVFTTGSIETTNVGTQIALNGDGFFITSVDDGRSYKYTRNGEFTLDRDGNYVNNQGYIVQGWVQDKKTGKVDTTAPIENIVVEPGKTIEARATTTVKVNANLDSGNDIGTSKTTISTLDSFHNAYDKNESGTVIQSSGPPVVYENGEEHSEDSTTNYKFDTDGNIIERGVNAGVLFDSNGDAVALREGQGIWVSYKDAVSTSTITATGANTYTFNLNGQDISVEVGAGTNAANTAEEIASKINGYSSKTGVVATTDGAQLTLTNDNNTGTTSSSKNIILTGTGLPAGMNATSIATARYYTYTDKIANPNPGVNTGAARTFKTTEDLRYAMQQDANFIVEGTTNISGTTNADIKVTVNDKGQFKITKTAGNNTIDIAITGYSDSKISQNSSFTSIMKAMNGAIEKNDISRTTQSLYAANWTTRTEIYDSLGSKHSLTVEYTKVSKSGSGTEWAVKVSVAEPGEISTDEPKNIVTGFVKFDDNGALSNRSPYNITYTPNNGAASDQNIELNLGTVGSYDGLTSYDESSSTKYFNADGYTGGVIEGTEIDSAGNVIGKFTNGKSITLAKVAVAKFTNNEGLKNEGGNMYTRTANSGEAVIGVAGENGRGTIASSSLEMSNVDLSRSLTQLIIVQRGFQANSKTITTSDQMLNTLLQLKQ